MDQQPTIANDMLSPLRPYQWEGVQFLRANDSALLADEMGLGKTVQALVALKLGKSIYRRVLVITPTSLSLNWLREFQTWAPELAVRRLTGTAEDRALTYRLPIQVLIASYEQVRLDIQGFQGYVRFDLVILDEAQRVKNPSSATTLACRLIQRDRSWALSGTPLENSPEDLISIFRFLKPQLLKAGMPLRELHSAMSPHFLRRTKATVLPELPPIIVRDIHLELEKNQRAAYDAVWSSRLHMIHDYEEGSGIANMLRILTRLKQLCNFEGESQESVKFDVLRSLLDSIRGTSEKVLIFSQYVETLKWLSQRIDIPHEVFHGSLLVDARERMISTFRHQSGPRALLLSLKAGGVGLNLQEASTVILFDRWWNPAAEEQAIQRAHRFGRRLPLQVIRFIVEDSVEERIAEVLEEKRGLFYDYVESASSQPEINASAAQLRHILAV